ncbi:fasciclin [Melaminivora suipulveris]|uniref:Fasciclin n=1 Tax=Melaminivora suipulveris TaxID=2109913 RepID=A0A2R3QFG9_9BURK|nr:fasciclin domain-containing protein [Melaminivora suipulveris]AVO50526.1 fasciclin [Melaminivora suipulveris]
MIRRHALHCTLALVTAAALGGCASPASAPRTVAAATAATPALSTFHRLAADAGLLTTLEGPGPYTVFAPSDAAFQALPAKTLDVLRADKAQLKAVLSHHVVPGRIAAADARPGKARTLQGTDIALARAGTYLTVEDALVERADLRTGNGVVHIVDRVLMPPRK